MLEGLTWRSLKKHPSLIPLFGFLGFGVCGAVFYTLRVAFTSPDNSIPLRDPQPWNAYRNKQYKFYARTEAEANAKSLAPEY